MTIAYKKTHIRNYKKLCNMLKMIMSKNKNVDNFNFRGILTVYGEKGILIDGIDIYGIREFKKFYNIGQIYKMFQNWCENKYEQI